MRVREREEHDFFFAETVALRAKTLLVCTLVKAKVGGFAIENAIRTRGLLMSRIYSRLHLFLSAEILNNGMAKETETLEMKGRKKREKRQNKKERGVLQSAGKQ